MAKIHSTAIVHPEAKLHDAVEVGPYAVIGPKVRLGAGTRVGPHAVIEGQTTLGERNRSVETQFDYGARVGVWRPLRLFAQQGFNFTVYGVGRALETAADADGRQRHPRREAGCDGAPRRRAPRSDRARVPAVRPRKGRGASGPGRVDVADERGNGR